eukprot:CAMPEP_0205854880 /NCGR_PEP_ID=MMETSP1083-20121108/2312_1 /ASSEMBLY_ACC=CAM_ASM_000430 /TAXON_ID=97485 /ORGANISM="Prymnesium parvum, Strain Texoma1" /LENGTH=79 /DNA_ID=CAMNT_0053216227 /DNA_START=1739 /DNA_END=1978 /DNA_ORIENTATION=-
MSRTRCVQHQVWNIVLIEGSRESTRTTFWAAIRRAVDALSLLAASCPLSRWSSRSRSRKDVVTDSNSAAELAFSAAAAL